MDNQMVIIVLCVIGFFVLAFFFLVVKRKKVNRSETGFVLEQEIIYIHTTEKIEGSREEETETKIMDTL